LLEMLEKIHFDMEIKQNKNKIVSYPTDINTKHIFFEYKTTTLLRSQFSQQHPQGPSQ